MIDCIVEIIKLYLNELDREYDNDMVLLAEKVLNQANDLKKDINILLSAVPTDISEEIKGKLRLVIK